VWGNTITHDAWGLMVPAPAPAPSTDVESDAAEVIEVHDRTGLDQDQTTTDIAAHGGLSVLGRWLVRFWLRFSIHRRR
jgi:hypothetical protein